jgi:hypothetical protein
MAQPLYQPLGVVAMDECGKDLPRLGETLELMQIQALLLQRPHEPFGHAVAFRFTDVGRRDRHPEPLHFVDPGCRDVLRPPVAAQPQPAGDVLGKGPVGLPYALPDRLERSPAIAQLGDMPADDFIRVVIEGPKEPAPPLALRVETGGARPPT